MTYGGKHSSRRQVVVEARKDRLLTLDERREAVRLRRLRFSIGAIARAIGRSVPDVQAFLDSPEAKHV